MPPLALDSALLALRLRRDARVFCKEYLRTPLALKLAVTDGTVLFIKALQSECCALPAGAAGEQMLANKLTGYTEIGLLSASVLRYTPLTATDKSDEIIWGPISRLEAAGRLMLKPNGPLLLGFHDASRRELLEYNLTALAVAGGLLAASIGAHGPHARWGGEAVCLQQVAERYLDHLQQEASLSAAERNDLSRRLAQQLKGVGVPALTALANHLEMQAAVHGLMPTTSSIGMRPPVGL